MRAINRKITARTPLVYILCFLVVIVGIIIYANSFDVPFQFDDIRFIVDSDDIKDLSNIPALFDAFQRREIVGLSLAINYHLCKLDTFGYHIFNTAVHIINSLLVYALVILIFSTPELLNHPYRDKRVLLAAAASLIFLCHPVQTNAVTYIWQRAASIAAMFYFLAIVSYIKGRLSKNPVYFIVALLSSFAALFSKENTVTLPFMFFICEIFLFGLYKKPKLAAGILLGALVAILAIIPVWISLTWGIKSLSYFESLTRDGPIPRHIYLLTQFNVIRTYLHLLIFPLNLNLDYQYPLASSLSEGKTFLSLLLHLGIIGFGAAMFKRHRPLSLGIFWFYITLSPESSIIPIKDVIFEHRLYLPLPGFAIFLSTLLFSKLNNSKRFCFVMGIIIIILSTLTIKRNIIWQDEFTLWNDVLSKSPNKARPHCNLAMAYGKLKEYDKAIHHAKIAVALDPGFAQAHYNLGLAYSKKHVYKKAIEYYQNAVNADPLYVKAYYNMGLAYRKSGDYKNAIKSYLTAIEHKPNYTNAHNNIVVVYLKTGQAKKAKEHINILKKLGRNDLTQKFENITQRSH